MSRRPHPSGMSFVELLVVTTVFVTLLGLVWGFVEAQTKTFSRETGRSMRSSALRLWTDRFVRDVRRAGYDPLETNTATSRTFDIKTATPSEITFTADVDRDGAVDAGSVENLGYRLNGTTLERWQGGTSWRPLTEGVQTLAITYFDAAGSELDPEGSSFSVRNVAAVELTIMARSEDRTGPASSAPLVSRTVRASLRNLP